MTKEEYERLVFTARAGGRERLALLMMVHWAWLILAFVAGANIGVVLMGVIAGCKNGGAEDA